MIDIAPPIRWLIPTEKQLRCYSKHAESTRGIFGGAMGRLWAEGLFTNISGNPSCGGSLMPMLATSSPNMFLMVPPEGGFFDPPWTADLLRQFHGGGEIFALETFFSTTGFEGFVRSQSGRRKYHGTSETDSGRKKTRTGGTGRCSIGRKTRMCAPCI